MKYAWAVSCWSQMILEYFTRKVTVWFEGERRDEFQPLSLFWKAVFRLQTAAFGVYWHIRLLTAGSYHPPCLESWGDEVGLPCWVPIADCFSVEFLIHSRKFLFILLWSFSLNFAILYFSSDIQLICLFSHKGLITVHLCPSPRPIYFLFTPLGPPMTQPLLGSGSH